MPRSPATASGARPARRSGSIRPAAATGATPPRSSERRPPTIPGWSSECADTRGAPTTGSLIAAPVFTEVMKAALGETRRRTVRVRALHDSHRPHRRLNDADPPPAVPRSLSDCPVPGIAWHQCGPDSAVTGITNDSRAVRAGDLYAALPGLRVHGIDFLAQAIDSGAAAGAYRSRRRGPGDLLGAADRRCATPEVGARRAVRLGLRRSGVQAAAAGHHGHQWQDHHELPDRGRP